MFLSECGIVLILGNQEKALAVRSSVFEHLSSKSCDAELVVSKLKETLRLDQASLEQPDSDTKKQIRCLAREASRCNRPDVVEYLREITPAGTTGECFSGFLIIIPRTKFYSRIAYCLIACMLIYFKLNRLFLSFSFKGGKMIYDLVVMLKF